MKRTKGFTLVELLVVISIIALLMAVLVPSLNKARELAKRIVCSHHIHTFGIANSLYETTYGVYAPIAYDTQLPPQYKGAGQIDIYEGIWFSNKAFRRFLQIDSYRSVGNKNDDDYESLLDAPKEFTCPSDRISKYRSNISDDNVLLSYGYNMTEWVEEAWPTWPNDFYAGHGPGAVKNSAEKLSFIDAPDWWVQWQYADYERVWDEYGEITIDDLSLLGIYGPVFYRHDEGANVGFYDGHVEYMRKKAVFNHQDWINGRPGMWTVRSYY
jgi:prepilin-type N-terminal cleavage/methylation domain-containing protein/prepilin-type processing-associated H-X9-DG protein